MTFSYVKSCQLLLTKLDRLGIKLIDNALEPSPQYEESSILSKFEKTFFWNTILDHFDNASGYWVDALNENDLEPSWHVVTVDLDKSPLDADDWCTFAKSKVSALAHVIYQMQKNRATPVKVSNIDGRIEIMGNSGLLATIEPMPITLIDPPSLTRSTNALKGLHTYDLDQNFANRLSRIRGLENYSVEPGNDLKSYQNRQCLHVNCNNLCTSMMEAMELLAEGAITRSVAQELTAAFFDFDSWNHFKALEKQCANNAITPFYIYNIKDDSLVSILSFHLGLPSALHEFGKTLTGHKRKSFHISSDFQFRATNLTQSTASDFNKDGRLYSDDSGVFMAEMLEVDFDENYLYLAAILMDSLTFEKDLKEYFYADKALPEQILKTNAREGAKEQDHLFIGDWVFWISQRHSKYEILIGERVSKVGTIKQTKISSALHKASIVYQETKTEAQFWLATDWDKKPKYSLIGLTISELLSLEKAFIYPGNWSHELRRIHNNRRQ